MKTDDAESFEILTRTVSARAGLALQNYKDKCLRRRVQVRMRVCGVHTFDEYLHYLENHPPELELLVDALTINVTKFYRNVETWARLSESVLPGLLTGNTREVRVWSAGCASGEEPYSIAMVFADVAERLGCPGRLGRVHIDATDIDSESLIQAQEACYLDGAFSEAPVGTAPRFCTRNPDGRWRVSDTLRRRVRVSRVDLLLDPPPAPPYDLIMCRNVIIYLDRPSQDRLMEGFHRALGPGGVLVLGKVETLLGASRQRFDPLDVRERIFRRLG